MKNLPMDILRAFVAVADVKSVTLAGELLSRSQPAVSLQLKRLEDLIGKPLFNRSGKKLELTQSGTQLLGYAREILALNDEALSHFVEPDLSGTIRLGLPNEFATTLLPKVVGQFAKSHPNVTLEVTSDLSKNLMSRARERFDIVLALEEDPCHCDEPLIKVDELVWVTSSAHAAHQQEVIPMIAAPDGCIYRRRGAQVLKQAGQKWRIVYTIPGLSGMTVAIEEGLGVTILARSTVPGSLQIIKNDSRFPDLGKIGIRLVSTQERQTEPVRRLKDYIRASLR